MSRQIRKEGAVHRAARFFLAAAMSYFALRGFLRIDPAPASGDLLARPLGSLAPHQLLSLMLGWSYPLAIFISTFEVAAAILLLRPNTALAGALVASGILANVIAMGFFYAVPGWPLALLLLALAAIVIVPEGRRLYQLHLAKSVEQSVPPEAQISSDAKQHWSIAKRFGFRMLFTYAVLYTLFSEPIGWIFQSWGAIQSAYAVFIAYKVWPIMASVIPGHPNVPDYFWHVGAWGSLFLTPVIALIWSALDRHRTEYRTLFRWLHTLVRYVTASMMFDYAFIKFTGAQVWPPSIAEMTRSAGELLPPSRLFFATVSFSYGYMVFTGLGELTGGMLLLWRRTATLGALILVPLLLNVTLFNVFYHIGVQDRSAPLLLFALIILAPDMERLRAVYINGRPAPPTPVREPVLSGTPHVVLKLLILATFVTRLYGHLTGNAPMTTDPTVPLQGSYVVDSFALDGKPYALVPNDTIRWTRLDIAPYGRMTVARPDGSERNFRVDVDSAGTRIVVGAGMPAVRGADRDRAPLSPAPIVVGALLVTRLDSADLRFDGIVEEDTLSLRVHRLYARTFPLMHNAPPLAFRVDPR